MAVSAHVAVVDDEPELRATLAEYLELHGFRVSPHDGGASLRALLAAGDLPDLVLLDLRMPGEDGLSLARHLRETTDAGVIMLTAIAEPVDRILGLELGADDYIAKPFELREVLARIKAVLRRRRTARAAAASDGPRLHFAGWTLDLEARTLRHADGRQVALTAMEFDLLAVMARRPGVVFTREQLQDLAHGNAEEAFDRSIDIRITRLRKKLETDPSRPAIIKTVRGAGYVLADR